MPGRISSDGEIVLAGGVANHGAVVRVGDTVRRPPSPHSAAITLLLQHLEAVGFEGCPRFLGTDDRGREVLSWIDGEVPLPVFPPWSMSDEALASVARLLADFHRATEGFVPAPELGWSSELADPAGGRWVMHNDVCPENVLFRDGSAVALIDFEFAAPGRPVWDVVSSVSMWAPLAAPEFRVTHPPGLDPAHRAAVFADAYGLTEEDRRAFVGVVRERHRVGRAFVGARVAAGEAAFVEMFESQGGRSRWEENDRWLAAESDRLGELLLGGRPQ